MDYFNQYTSNTVAGSGNQHHFRGDPAQIITGRVFYRISAGGTYHYSLLFSNIIDGTFADGAQSHCNYICGSWKIHSARIGKCGGSVFGTDFQQSDVMARLHESTGDFVPVTFGGCAEKTVAPGEFFCTDPVELTFQKEDYLCLELTFSGRDIPYHEESILPVFRKTDSGWAYDRRMPLPGMVGCDRKAALRIGYLGDSITQGIGVTYNSYAHWNAVLSKKLGDRYAFWNLGLGFGRAADAASDSAWLYKARHNDVVFVCYGVNDLFRGRTREQIVSDLETVINILKGEGKKVVLQTVPPFNYTGDYISTWKAINAQILTTLAQKVDFVFDNVGVLSAGPDAPQAAKYGGHPDETGCALWGEALYDALTGAGVLA